jgi:hypothetical protein
MTAPDRGATYQIALASTGSSTHDAWYPRLGGLLSTQAVRKRGSINRVDLPCKPSEFLAIWGDQVRIAAMSGLTPRMAMTRLRL